jgi:hypothetical protein
MSRNSRKYFVILFVMFRNDRTNITSFSPPPFFSIPVHGIRRRPQKPIASDQSHYEQAQLAFENIDRILLEKPEIVFTFLQKPVCPAHSRHRLLRVALWQIICDSSRIRPTLDDYACISQGAALRAASDGVCSCCRNCGCC